MPRNYENAAPTQFQRLPEHTRDEAWIREILRTALIAHVAHSRDNQPFITPTNFWFDEANHRIIFHSFLTGRLRDNLEHNPRVCLEISELGHLLPANTAFEFSFQYRAVMVFGRVVILEDDSEKSAALYGLLKKSFPGLTPGKEYRPITSQELARTTVYAVQIESWSGKENWKDQAVESPDWPPLPAEMKQP